MPHAASLTAIVCATHVEHHLCCGWRCYGVERYLGGSVEDDHRANRIGVEPTTAEAKGSKPNTFTYFATHNWAMFAV